MVFTLQQSCGQLIGETHYVESFKDGEDINAISFLQLVESKWLSG
jgi:hypothetical protein